VVGDRTERNNPFKNVFDLLYVMSGDRCVDLKFNARFF
jgi:hypothetical protein